MRSDPFGCDITPVSAESLPIVGRELRDAYAEYDWLLAHCDDGVTWGCRDGGEWQLASAYDLAPEPTRKNLQQLRLFGKASELLMWRAGDDFRGRVLADAPAEGFAEWAKPMTERRFLVGRRIVGESRGRFSVVGDAHGSRHAVPLACTDDDFAMERFPLRLEIRHYLDRDDATGVVRIAASRLVDIWNDAQKEGRR